MGRSRRCGRGRFVESVFQSKLGGSFEIPPVDGWGRVGVGGKLEER